MALMGKELWERVRLDDAARRRLVRACEACGREYRKCLRNQRLCHECSVAHRGRRPNG